MMRFDNAVGNPPYQGEASGDNKNYMAPIYPDLMDLAYTIATRVVLITPARFLFNAGATRKAWNKKMLDDKHFRVIHYERNSEGVFRGTDIAGGVAVTYRDEYTIGDAIGIYTPDAHLRSTLHKVKKVKHDSIAIIITPCSKFKKTPLRSDGVDTSDKRFESNAFTVFDVFKKHRENNNDIRVLGRYKGKRTYRYIDSSRVSDVPSVYRHTVFLPKTSGTGSDRVIGKPLIGDYGDAHTRTYLAVGIFENENEAYACLKYIKTKFARAMLSTLKVTQNNARHTWKNVPLQDFTEQSDIDWTQTIHEIDQQLYAKYNLNDEEIAFIESNIKQMD